MGGDIFHLVQGVDIFHRAGVDIFHLVPYNGHIPTTSGRSK
jgi:hypothetical protein